MLVLTFCVYLPSLDNEFTNWDDEYYVTENPLLANPTLGALLTANLGGNYHPLTMATLALNYRISGLNPASYHWFNLILHLANTALVFFFIRKLSGGRFWTTVGTALFFGIHPMHVESVAWISERKDVLYAFLYLIGLIAYLRYLVQRRPAWLVATFLAFVLSVASKPAAVVFPLTLLAIDYFRRRPWTPAVALEKAPFFAASLAGGLLTLVAQRFVGAVASPHVWSPFQKLLFASYGTVMYVVKLFVPVGLSAIYPYPNPNATPSAIGPEFYVALGALAILLPAIVYLCRRVPVVLFGIGFFFINLVLVLQFFTVGQAVMADRYTYLPYIGLFFALTWWLDEGPGTVPGRLPLRPAIAGGLLLLLPFSLVQTWRRCDVWQNSGTLWNDTIRKYPSQIANAYNNRGCYSLDKGNPDAGLADFDRALAIDSTFGRAWLNKGTVFAERSVNDSALVCFERAVALMPKSYEALNNRGAIKVRFRDLAGAVEDCSRAIAVNPSFRGAYTNRAYAYSLLGEFERSIADRRRAIELDPRNPTNYLQWASIGSTLQQLGRHREAITQYGEAIRTAPPGDRRLGDYYLRRSRSWLATGDRNRALGDAREAARLGAKVDSTYLRQLGG